MTTTTFKYYYQDQADSLQCLAASIGKRMALYVERSHQRRQLARLSNAQLEDLGISRQAALLESRKSFWMS